MDDIAGKFSKAQRQLATEIKQSAGKNKETTEKQKSASKFANGVHKKEFRETQTQLAMNEASTPRASNARRALVWRSLRLNQF